MNTLKNLLAFYSTTNQHINTDLAKIIGGISTEELDRGRGTFHGSLMGLLNHILVSDLGWYSVIRDSSAEFPILNSPVLKYTAPEWGSPLYDTIDRVLEHQKKIDELARQFIESLSDNDIAGTYTFDMWMGRADLPLSAVLLHVLNHATHHRGAIAQILDEMGIENDYSNIIFQVPGAPAVDNEEW